jgi:hypothetical protein
MKFKSYRKTLLVTGGVLFISCSDGDQIVTPPHLDLFDKLTTRRIVPASALPNLPANLEFVPESKEFLVLNKTGEVHHFILEDLSARFLGEFTVPEVAPAPEEIGLTGIAFDPDFASNRFFYVCFTK